MIERAVRFTEDDVLEWCQQANDQNPLHLSEDVAGDGPFGERVVPGMMVLDNVSGVLTEYGNRHDDNIILANLVSCRFREPIPIGSTVSISVSEADEDGKFTYFDFQARVDGQLCAHGTVSVVIVDR